MTFTPLIAWQTLLFLLSSVEAKCLPIARVGNVVRNEPVFVRDDALTSTVMSLVSRLLRRRVRARSMSAATTLPGEVLMAICAYIEDDSGSWTDRCTLRAVTLVCRHWNRHGGNAALYSRISLYTKKACTLLDRTVASNPAFADMINSLNMIPWVLRPLYNADLSTLVRGQRSECRHAPDDAESVACVLRIVRKAHNLRTLAVKVVEDSDVHITFRTLEESIASRQLTTLSLSGDVRGSFTTLTFGALLRLLQSPACSKLDELLIRQYLITASGDGPQWTAEGPLPPITRLWASSCVWNSAIGWEQRSPPDIFHNILRGTLRDVRSSETLYTWRTVCKMWSSSADWTRLQSLSIGGVVEANYWDTLDLSQMTGLQELCLAGSIFTAGTSRPVIFPPNITSFVALISRNTTALQFFAKFGPWLRQHSFPATLATLCVRADCSREWKEAEMWKILIFALRLRDEDTSFEVIGDICIYLDPTRTRIPFGEPMNDRVVVQLPAPGTAQGGRRQSRISRVWSNVGATWRRRSIRGSHASP